MSNNTIAVKRIYRWDFFSESRTLTPRIFIIGKSGVGKSIMMHDLLFRYNELNGIKGAIIMPKKDWRINNICGYGYSTEYHDLHKMCSLSFRSSESFLVFENIKYNKEGIVSLAKCLYNPPPIMTISVVEYPREMPKLSEQHQMTESSIDFFCIFADRNMYVEDLRTLYTIYVKDVFPSFEAFYTILMGVCDKNPYECLVVRTRGITSLNLCDNIFWYRKEELHPPFEKLRKKMDVHRKALIAAVCRRRCLLLQTIAQSGGNDDDWLWTR